MAVLESLVEGKYSTVDARSNLQRRIVELVHDPAVRRTLRARNLLGVLQRYKDEKSSKDNIWNAQQHMNFARLGAYTINNADGEIVGMATVLPALPLRRQRTGIPPKLARVSRGLLASEVKIAGPEVSAWTNETNPAGARPLLSAAYAELLRPMGLADTVFGRWRERLDTAGETGTIVAYNPWTVEPIDTHIAHDAIRAAGLSPAGNGYYDDGESAKLFPPEFVPVSRLYVRSPKQLDSQG